MIDFIATHAAIIGLLFFFTIFTATALWLVRPGAKSLYKTYSEIPLKEAHDGQ